MNAVSRSWLLVFCALAVPALAYAQPTQEDEAEPVQESTEQDPDGLRVFWRDGFRAETDDGQFQLRLGGRLQTDFNWAFEKEPFGGLLGDFDNGMEVRRARIQLQGYVWERVEYSFEVDFAGGTVGAKDMYVGVRGWPLAARIGHLKEPLSIEELTSSRFITFLERSLVNMFAPSRNTGLITGSAFADDRSSWAAGIFRETDGFAASTGDNYNLTARFTHAAVISDDSRQLLHFGVAATHKWIDGNLRLSTRPGDHNAPRIIEINIPAGSADYLSAEVAANLGSLGIQAEYLSAWVSSPERGDPRLYGYYLQNTYFFTGETRPYDRGRFVRLSPARNFPGGPGAWELGLRYALVDVSDGLVDKPGRLWNLTAGLNWYWNPNLRFMFNYERAQLPQLDTEAFSAFHMRVSFDF